MSNRPIVLMHSGGIGSTVAAARLAAKQRVRTLFIDYGQASGQAEVAAVRALTQQKGWPDICVVAMPHIKLIGDQYSPQGWNSPTAVNRRPALDGFQNETLLASILITGIQFALNIGAESIVTGLYDTSEVGRDVDMDRPYWRRRPGELIHSLNILIESMLLKSQNVELVAPFSELPLSDLIRLGNRLQAPLAQTRSCEQESEHACGTCPKCEQRRRAFEAAGLEDHIRAANFSSGGVPGVGDEMVQC